MDIKGLFQYIFSFTLFVCVCLCVCLLCVYVKVPTETRIDSSEMELDVVSCAKLVLGTELWSFAKHKALLSDDSSSLQPRRHFFY